MGNKKNRTKTTPLEYMRALEKKQSLQRKLQFSLMALHPETKPPAADTAKLRAMLAEARQELHSISFPLEMHPKEPLPPRLGRPTVDLLPSSVVVCGLKIDETLHFDEAEVFERSEDGDGFAQATQDGKTVAFDVEAVADSVPPPCFKGVRGDQLHNLIYAGGQCLRRARDDYIPMEL